MFVNWSLADWGLFALVAPLCFLAFAKLGHLYMRQQMNAYSKANKLGWKW